MDTPETRRDIAIAEAVEVGASVIAVEPLAHPDTPHTIAAYRVTFGAPDPTVLAALTAVRADTEVNLSGLVPFVPELEEVDRESTSEG